MYSKGFILILIVIVAGCIDPKTPQELLKEYGCYYFPQEHGFCCEKEVPEELKYIFNCEYAIQ
jgi:hypothetical protein